MSSLVDNVDDYLKFRRALGSSSSATGGSSRSSSPIWKLPVPAR
jgi:hypothetical protein